MTIRSRRQARPGLGTRLRALVEGEERQQAVVTALFIGTIVLVVLALLGAVGLAWYNDNLRPLARVGSVEIRPQDFRKVSYLKEMMLATIWGLAHGKNVVPVDWWDENENAREVRDKLAKQPEYVE